VDALSGVATVILDAPPLLSVTDAAILGTIADGVVITVGAKQVTAEQLQKAYRSVTRVNGKVLGAVLNKIPPNGIDSHDYGYYRNDYYTTHEAESQAESESPAGAEPQAGASHDEDATSSRRDVQRTRKSIRAAR